MKCEKEYIFQIYSNLCMTDVVRCSEVERSMFGNIPRHFLPVRGGENSTDILRVPDSCRPHGSSTLHLIKREECCMSLVHDVYSADRPPKSIYHKQALVDIY